MIPLIGASQDRIVGDSKVFGQIDSFGGCSAFDKSLGDPSGIPGACSCGDPIGVGAGSLFEEVADYQVSGPNKLGFTRYYNSQGGVGTLAVALGTNWRSTYDRYLRIESATSVTAERHDGRQLSFTLTGGSWTSDSDVDLKLTNSGSSWTLTDSADSVETYTDAGATSSASAIHPGAKRLYARPC